MNGRALQLAVAAMLVAGCGGAIPTVGPTTLGPTPSGTAASPSASASPVTPSPAPSAGDGPLTGAETAGLTGGALVPLPPDAPGPVIDATAAEAIVRARYPGERATIGVERITMKLPAGVRTGWFVALTPADGEPCALHAGLLPRAIEGGIVDDQTSDLFWIFTCGP